MEVTPYLNFDGRCEEALEFYRQAVGAEVTSLMHFSATPFAGDPNMVPPGTENKVMHATFRIGKTTLMASDGRCMGKESFQGISLAIEVPDVPASERLFAALSDGGAVEMPLTKTFWSPSFGMLADRFGVRWMISVTA